MSFYLYYNSFIRKSQEEMLLLMTKIPNLFKIMKEKGITAKKLSNATGISCGNISDWKSGRSQPSIEALKTISAFLNVSIDLLLENGNFSLSKEEQELIIKYRHLNNEQKKEIKTYFETSIQS